ncbi:MAG: NAD(P)H-dependent oxidoreductase [Rhodothalassiaceae bacterium]
MARRITVIDGHPDPRDGRLVHALADAYAKAAEQAGHEIKRLRVADMDLGFLRRPEEFDQGEPNDSVKHAQAAIEWAEHLVILYPLWMGTVPALLKAFFEQVFRPRFALDYPSEGWPKGRLKGRSARIIITMAMPALAYRFFYRAHSLKSLERNILKLVGLGPFSDTLIGMVGKDQDQTKAVEKVAALGQAGR